MSLVGTFLMVLPPLSALPRDPGVLIISLSTNLLSELPLLTSSSGCPFCVIRCECA